MEGIPKALGKDNEAEREQRMDGQNEVFDIVGTYTCTVDSKGRVMIPAKFRHSIPSDLKNVVIITKSKDRCLNLYPLNHWRNVVMGKLAELKPSKMKKELSRYYSANSAQVNIDKAGRIAIPPKFLAELGNPKKVVIVGMLSYMEIWSPERYKRAEEEAVKTYMESDWEL